MLKCVREYVRCPGVWLSVSLLLAASMSAAAGQAGKQGEKADGGPAIKITLIPVRGEGSSSWGDIGGEVAGVACQDCKVVVFAQTDKWYVQPFTDSPYTEIKGSTWKTGTHLGYRYAALLVKSSFKPPHTTGTLPEVGDEVLAIAEVPAKEK